MNGLPKTRAHAVEQAMKTFESAFAAGSTLTPAELLTFHKARFGDLRMDGDDDGGDEGDKNKGDDKSQGGQDPAPDGFPADTPVADMTPEQQAAYWKHQSRQHESRAKSRADYEAIKAERDKLKQANETDTDKAIREAREAGAADAIKTSFDKTAKALLRMGLRSANVEAKDIDEIVDQANLSAFADEHGDVDDEKVARYIKRNAGTAAQGQWPGTGQDRRGGGAPKESGSDLWERHYGSKKK